MLEDTDIPRLVELTEGAAYADLLCVAPAAWGSVAERSSLGWFLFAPKLDVLLFNRVIGCGLDVPARREDLHERLDRYRAAGLRNFGVALSPAAQPPDLAEWLGAEGMSARDNWTKVYRAGGACPEPATELRIERAAREHAGIVARIACAAFGMPAHLEAWIAGVVGRAGWHHYLAWLEDDAVATAALFVHESVGWLGIAGTLPRARCRGAQGALMARRLCDGTALGCRWFVTETGEDLPERPNPSFHNMVRAGFTVAYQRPNYLMTSRRPGGAETSGRRGQ